MKLFIRNLNYQTGEPDLEALFAEVGPVVRTSLARDRETGASRGFGFVEFENADDAKQAIHQFHGIPFQGRRIHVEVSRT